MPALSVCIRRVAIGEGKGGGGGGGGGRVIYRGTTVSWLFMDQIGHF